MAPFFEHVMADLEQGLAAVKLETNSLKRFSICVGLVEGAIKQLRSEEDFISGYTGQRDQHILFNRVHFPPLFSKLLYFRLCLDFERQKLSSTKDGLRGFCERQLEFVAVYFSEYAELMEYYYSGKTDLDDALFSWDNTDSLPEIAHDNLFPPMNNPACLKVAVFVAYEQYAIVLKREIEGVDNQPQQEARSVTWQYNETDLIEQLLGQYEAKTTFVDGRPATLDFLARQACSMYQNISFKQLSGLIANIQRRKAGNVVHHKRLIAALERRSNRLLLTKVKKTLENERPE
jgi:RteC protein